MNIERISIKAARVIADLTRAELAEKMKVSRDAVKNWELGITGMNGKNLQRFCEITGFRAEEIILPVNSTKAGENE